MNSVLGRARSLSLVARFLVVGLTVGVLVAAGIGWFIEERLRERALEQIASRAADQVELAASGRVDPADLAAPHGPDKAARLAAQLRPLTERVAVEASGILRVHLFAPDGTIVYSNQPDVVGVVINPASSPYLAAALDGVTGTKFSGLTSAKVAKLRERHDGALEVYVPFRVDGQVVGAYEVYHDLRPIRAIRPLVWGVVAAGFGLLFSALLAVVLGAAALIRRQQAERLRLIEDAAEAAALRRMDGIKSELISVVNHELRSPLTSLVGFSELLLTGTYPEKQQRQFLELMNQESLRLAALIDEFLDLQRVESGRQQIISAPASLSTVLERAVAAAGEQPDHPISVDVPVDLPLVAVDVDRLRQVMSNLLSNAVKYSPGGGAVRVAARLVDGAVEVSVSDEGLGIPPDAMPRLFTKFYRIDNSDRRRIQGTGLGLAIVKEIVAAHGGRAWATSRGLGRGATFSFTVPLADTRRERADVLVVDDDSGFATLLQTELARVGVSASHAKNVPDAIERVEVVQPRVVLLDLVLPGLKGEAFLWRLRELDRPPPRVVVVTKKELTPSEEQDLRSLGAAAVLRKGPDLVPAVLRLVAEVGLIRGGAEALV